MSNVTRRQNAVSPSSTMLSTGAIAGIAIGGAALLFFAIAGLLLKLSRRTTRRRTSNSAFGNTVESGIVEVPGPKRLRKRSIIGRSHLFDKDNHDGEDVPPAEQSNRSSLDDAISPMQTRQGSVSMGDESKSGSRRGSVDTSNVSMSQSQILVGKSRDPEKQRGYGVYQHRRKTSWIDEDALHGPTITSPQRTKQKHRRMMSWFDGGLSRSLSRLSTRSGMGEISPTLPSTETPPGAPMVGQQYETPVESPAEQSMRSSQQGARFSYTTTPSPNRQQQQQQQMYPSPQRSYGPSSLTSPGSGSSNPAQSPPDIVHNPRYRNKVSFQAAQQLAGTSRLPAPINTPQGQGQGPGQGGRPAILKHSATDTELTQILQMTADRLQDGHRSARRQTLMSPYTPYTPYTPNSGRRVANEPGQYYYYDGRPMEYTYDPTDRGDISPVKSHKSAPATMSYAELEGCTPTAQSPQRQIQTPRHSRQPSHNPRISQQSMISEPDSLVAPKRESLSEVRTALSSPSRVTRSTEPSPSPQGQKQQSRPFSNGSTMSSALSTLYSMEEASIRSPPAGDLNFGSSPAYTPRRTPEKVLSAFGMLKMNRNSGVSETAKSPTRKFDDDDIPPPLRIRRGTLGGSVVPNNTPASRPASRQNGKSVDLSKSRSSFMVHASSEKDDPFTAEATPRNAARLSKVFSPLPVDFPRRKSDPKHTPGSRNASQESQFDKTPTPSPSRRMAMPSPRTILNSPSNPKRAPSPATSEAGLSSVYDSYTYTHGESQAEGAGDRTPRCSGSPSQFASQISTSGRESRVGFRMPNYSPCDEAALEKIRPQPSPQLSPQLAMPPPGSPLRPRRSMPSDGSLYSQDGDRVPPLRSVTVKRGKSVRMSTTITELRRMNSQVSVMSDQSTASATVPLMRGGGFSPGRQSEGGKNYLALGGALKSSSGSMNGAELVERAGARASSTRRVSVSRARRGTVVLQGVDAMKSGNSNERASPKRYTQRLRTQAAKLKSEETAIKRASVESLYDREGFLKD
ncbi:hypothetical protein F4781DRAFT_159353 [Annulohypoxylon bovei var. microspora]|nr:hypothetical protein F4781DRAFT_159353 [Annulohypoxylon bovei var. microspora]